MGHGTEFNSSRQEFTKSKKDPVIQREGVNQVRATHFDQLDKIFTGYEIIGARSSGIFLGILFIIVGSRPISSTTTTVVVDNGDPPF